MNRWQYMWEKFEDKSPSLFKDYIYPNTLDDFRGKTILDCGCGRGTHLKLVASYAKEAVGVDLNTDAGIKADVENMDLGREFDVVYCIGLLHHLDDPKAINNMKRHLKKNGRLIIWVYSYEGNFFNRTVIEFLKKAFFLRINMRFLIWFSHLFAILLSMVAVFPFLPYLRWWRRLSYKRKVWVVFDRLNAPETNFIKRETIEDWFKNFVGVHIDHHNKVSWRASGTKGDQVQMHCSQ